MGYAAVLIMIMIMEYYYACEEAKNDQYVLRTCVLPIVTVVLLLTESSRSLDKQLKREYIEKR